MVYNWLPFTLLVLPFPAFGGLEKSFGVAPALLSQYTPQNSGTWRCLDGSKEISWQSVNDDYCDCLDGSDEPGTSACANGTFYCRNEGHIGASISSSRVNDGLCEPECCDGTDERSGLCLNRCKEVGKAFREKRDAERKIRKTGAKIRSTYIAFAHKEKKRLETLLSTSEQEIAAQEKEVARLKDIAERAESLSAEALEHKQKSPLYTSLITHSLALKSLQREYKKHVEREQALGDILDALRSGYNPNYQDMAVLEAVRGWEFLADLEKVEENEEGSDNNSDGEVATTPEEMLEQGMWTAEMLDQDLDGLLKSDYVTLLLEHEEHIRSSPSDNLLFDLSDYIPDPLMEQYETVKDTIVSWMQSLGILQGDQGSSTAATQARQAFNNADRSLKLAIEEKAKREEDLKDIFDINGFGAEGEWKKLDGTCLELDTGEYIYEVCLFDEARQKPKHGGSTFSLGKFSSWNLTATPGTPEYYTKQIYNEGARCWNGPQRSVALVLSCGTQNELLTSVELEKCEYQITGTSPALCLPLDARGRDEL